MKTMRITWTWLIALALSVTLAVDAFGRQTAPLRTIPVPKEEHGYSNFDSTVITSQAELDNFLKTAHAQGMGWNNWKTFEKAISQAQLDFSKEALILLRHTEGSGSVQVDFCQPLVEGKRVICKIKREEPEIGTSDMAYYCFALAINKTNITEVELRVSGRKPILLSLKNTTKSNKSDADDGF